MKTFTDNAKRTWSIEINVAVIKRCRAVLGIDLYALLDHRFEGLRKLLEDIVRFVDLLYLLCEEQAKKDGVSDEEFGRAMRGDALGHATDAFKEELRDFFPDPRRRAGIAKVFEKMEQVRDQLLQIGTAELDNLDTAKVARAIVAAAVNGNGLSGAVPESSESTPAPSPSES